MYYGGYGFYFDWTYILVLIGAVISGLASLNVTSTFNRYRSVGNREGLTAERAAQEILQASGIYDVGIERISGNLTDHYSPQEKVLRLSDSVYGSTSVAAIGVAAHECGHAVQDKEGYPFLKLRSISVPLARIGSMASWPVLILGIVLGITGLARFGVLLFTLVVLFQLITLPVEFNASRRALAILRRTGMMEPDEVNSASKVLIAAALTYVAALFTSIMQLLRMIILMNNNSRRRR